MSSVKKDILFRVALVYFLMGVLGIAVIVKAAYTQIFEGAELTKLMETISLKDIIIEPTRGDILATDGRILATSVPSYEIRMDTRVPGLTDAIFNAGIDSLSLCLSKLPGKKPASVYKREITNARKRGNAGDRYLLLASKVNYNDLKLIKKFPIFRLGQHTGGLITVSENDRKLPHEGLARRTIGYLTKEPNGNFPGLEGAYDVYLRGERGVGMKQKLSGGTLMPVKGADSVEPKDGGDVVSTIDVNIQDVAETSLHKRLIHHNAHHGSVVVMEVATGEVKAIVNLGKNENGSYSERYNYALGEAVEPGSTFKLMTYMVALEDGYIQLTDSVNNGSGKVKYYDKLVTDDNRQSTMGWLTVEEAFALSSNVSITKIINKYYRDKQKQFIDRLYSMNLNQKLGLELSGESEPDIKYPGSKLWSGVSLTQMAYGYEVLLAPIHTLTFYNAVANNGRMVKPQFVKEFRRRGSVERKKETEIVKSSISSAATIRKVKKMMEAVVEYGTAKHIKTDLYPIAGKTGTAQIANGKFGFRDKKHYASFVGYFPADRPKYSCIVTVYAPTLNGTGGGTVAAPVFREIADKIYAADPDMNEPLRPEKEDAPADIPYAKSGFYKDLSLVFKELKIPVRKEAPKADNAEWVSVTSGDERIEVKNRNVYQHLVPNVVDMGLKDALFLLEQRGMQVAVRGRGRIISQSIAPGSEIARNRSIVLEMSQ
ncbi:MAG: transpeptidase family protein [Bacteroidales bacterium]|jgi:cell division protein FtsI (penicillin-binding protein 3)|nr:transpeptidase family protein [Bacteroidales bacterium]